MPPFDSTVEPVALKDQAVELSPSGDVYKVEAIEQMGRVGPFDYGAVSANDTATDGGSDVIELDDELEMTGSDLGQFWVNPLSDVEIEVRQVGQQDQRFVSSNQVGEITMNTPLSMRQLYVHGSDVPQVIISNPRNEALAKSLVYFTGFKLKLADQPMSQRQQDELSGDPAAVPVDTLKQ